jgi:hypothetical protein
MQRLPFQFVSGRSSLPAVPVSRSRSVMVRAALSASCVLALVTPATGVGPCDSVADAYARAQCVLGEMQAAGSVSPGNLAPNMAQTPQYGGAAGCTTSGCSGAPQEGYFSNSGDIAPLNAAATNATVMNPTYSTLQDQKSSKDGWDVSTTAPVKTAEALATSITPSPGLSGTCVDIPTCVEYTAGPESVQTCQSPGVETAVCEVNTFVTITHKTQTGSFGPAGWCSDHYLYAQVRQIGPGYYSIEYLDLGPEGIWHKNCGHGGGWHVLGTFNYAASLAPGETILTESFSASISGWQNGGCTGFGSTTLGPGQSALVALCPAGGAQSGGIQMTLAYDVQVRKDVITDSCAPLRSSWVFESSRCLDSAARQITSSDGTIFTITDVACWREQEQWMTTSSSPDTCQPLLEKGCSQISSTCVPDSFGRCQVYENTFSCASTPTCSRTVTMAQCNQCGVPGSYVPFCVDTSTPPNQYLALSATYLQLVKDVENDWDTTNLRVFNGTRMACDYNPIIRPIIDCCDASDPTRLLGSCSDEEVQLAKDRQLYKAHYVGTRCVEWVSFGFAKVCTRKEQVYCDFKSELARIVQEQGRAQLGWLWGSADAPDCSGFSITQFSSLNFATMDFTEWYVHVNANIDPAAVASDMNAKICAYSGKC